MIDAIIDRRKGLHIKLRVQGLLRWPADGLPPDLLLRHDGMSVEGSLTSHWQLE